MYYKIHTLSFSGTTLDSCTAIQSNSTHPKEGLANRGCPANAMSTESPSLSGQSSDVPAAYQSIRVLVRLVLGRWCCEDWARWEAEAEVEGRGEGVVVVGVMAGGKVTSLGSEGYRITHKQSCCYHC